MWDHINNKFIYLLCIVFFSITISFASDEDAKKDTQKEDSKEIANLVEKLASPNPKPIIPDKYVESKIIYSPNYSKEAQNRIYEVRKKIEEKGMDAFPYLIEHYNDDRYSITYETSWNGCWYNASVGSECADIVHKQLQPLGPFRVNATDAGDKRPYYDFHFLYSKDTMQSWYKTNKDKSLRELQIEVLEWTITEEKKKNDPKYDEDIKYLSQELDKLKKSDKSLPPYGDRP